MGTTTGDETGTNDNTLTDRHILITGQGRSGSTMFFNMLKNTLAGFDFPTGECRATDVLGSPGNSCSKRPFDIFEMPKILRGAEGRKRLDVIVMLRDPRDILTSIHPAVPDDYFCSADFCYYLHGENGPQKSLPGFLLSHFAILDLLKSGAIPQGVFLLKYEHLIADPTRIQAKLSEALDVRFDGRFADFHHAPVSRPDALAMNGARPVSADRIAKWRAPEHRDRIIDQFTRFPLLHDVLIDLGYETDTDWFEEVLDQPRRLRRTG